MSIPKITLANQINVLWLISKLEITHNYITKLMNARIRLYVRVYTYEVLIISAWRSYSLANTKGTNPKGRAAWNTHTHTHFIILVVFVVKPEK